MKIIAFSLWGNNPKYTVGAIKNADIAGKLFPEWICRFYIGKSVPENIVSLSTVWAFWEFRLYRNNNIMHPKTPRLYFKVSVIDLL